MISLAFVFLGHVVNYSPLITHLLDLFYINSILVLFDRFYLPGEQVSLIILTLDQVHKITLKHMIDWFRAQSQNCPMRKQNYRLVFKFYPLHIIDVLFWLQIKIHVT